MACVRSWDVLAILCGFPDSETMLSPYLLWSATNVCFEPITDARLGFAPLASRHRLWHGQRPSVDPAVVDAAALRRLDALPRADRALRTAAVRFVEHVVAVSNGKDVWSNTYNPLSMRADIGSLSGASFLRPRRTLVDGLAPVLSSYLKQLRLPVEADPADARDAFQVVDRALAEECRTYELDFWKFPVSRLQLRVQLLLTDIPWNTRRVAGNDNSDHDVFTDSDRGVLVRQGGHAIIMCSFSQFSDLSKTLESYKAPTTNESLWAVDAGPMAFICSTPTGAPRSTTTLANHMFVAVHATRRGAGLAGHRMVNYRVFDSDVSSMPGNSNVYNHVTQPTGREVVYAGDGILRPEQKPVSLLRELIRRFTKPSDVVLDLFAGSFSTADACIQTRRHSWSCDKDPVAVRFGKRRVFSSFVRFLSSTHDGRAICERDAELASAVTTTVGALDRNVLSDDRPPAMRPARRSILQPPATEMVPHTVLPRHIVDHVVAAYVPLAAADVVTPVEIGAMYATHPRKWRRALRFLFEDFPLASLRAADASACGVRLGVSTVPDAGLGCFVSRPDGFGAQHTVGSLWGPVVWHNCQMAHRFGLCPSAGRRSGLSTTGDRSSARRVSPPTRRPARVGGGGGRGGGGGGGAAAPAHDARDASAAGALAPVAPAPGPTRSPSPAAEGPNAVLKWYTDIRAVEDLSRDDTLTLVTTRAVAFGEELLVDYGADFEW
ncbi:hypothetical protein BU14_0070s0059, partial [Porphyra umbilicalis]